MLILNVIINATKFRSNISLSLTKVIKKSSYYLININHCDVILFIMLLKAKADKQQSQFTFTFNNYQITIIILLIEP